MTADTQEPYKRITPDQARALLNGGAQVIDVRESFEWRMGHIAEAEHIPLNQVLSQPNAFADKQDIVFVCAVGGRSAVACELAAAAGARNVYNLEGGMDSWQAKGYPVAR